MDLKENLYLRLNILEENNVINKKVVDYVKQAIDILLEEKKDITTDKAEMFFTHLAMASMRAINKEEENPVDERVLEAVKQESVFEDALKIRDKILEITDVDFSETEKDFLSIHLCNILL